LEANEAMDSRRIRVRLPSARLTLTNCGTVALPTQVTTYLHILKTASQAMFGLFLTATCLTFILIFLAPIVIYSRWWSFPVSVLLLLSTLCTVIASAIGTAISVIFDRAATSYQELNIQANVGRKMFAFTWFASAFSLLALLFHLGMSCCCASRRDVRTGRRQGSKKAYGNGNSAANVSEKPGRNLFGRRS
jgi:SUR7/PalI family